MAEKKRRNKKKSQQTTREYLEALGFRVRSGGEQHGDPSKQRATRDIEDEAETRQLAALTRSVAP
jgi:hypothetical protein